MNKRGFIIEAGAVILIVLTTLGIVITASNSTSLIVGDKNTGKFLDYYKCKDLASQIKSENLIVFPSQNDAINQKYNATLGCV